MRTNNNPLLSATVFLLLLLLLFANFASIDSAAPASDCGLMCFAAGGRLHMDGGNAESEQLRNN